MTFQNTIQLLYADIAAIKEFICKSNSTDLFEEYLGGSGEPQTYLLSPNTKKIVVYAYTNLVLSKIFDRYSSQYDEYLFDGLGTICQVQQVGNSLCSYPSNKINMELMVFDRIPKSTRVHVRPTPTVDLYVWCYT